MTYSLRTDNDLSSILIIFIIIFVGSQIACHLPVSLTCSDARCLMRCHLASVSNSCHFFRTPPPVRGRHTQSLRGADKPVQNVPSRDGYRGRRSRIVP